MNVYLLPSMCLRNFQREFQSLLYYRQNSFILYYNLMMKMVKLQVRLGWTEAAMIAGARALGVSPSIIGSFPRKEAALVEVNKYFSRGFCD